jgi:hypothetical protein
MCGKLSVQNKNHKCGIKYEIVIIWWFSKSTKAEKSGFHYQTTINQKEK